MIDDQEKLNARIRDIQKRLRDRDDSDLAKVMELAEGRRLLWSILEDSRVFRETFSAQALEMAHREGRRGMGLDILKQILRLDSARFVAMQNEAVHDNLRLELKAAKGEANG